MCHLDLRASTDNYQVQEYGGADRESEQYYVRARCLNHDDQPGQGSVPL